MTSSLTPEQEAFLEECELEFSDRFTEADLDYKKIYDLGVPTPPIMCPWYGRSRFNNRGEGRFHDRRDNRNDNYRDRNSYSDHRSDRNSYEERNERRYRPY